MNSDELAADYNKKFQDAFNDRDWGRLEFLQQEAARKVADLRTKEESKAELEAMKLQYNPIEEIVGPDKKKTIQLRKELQLEGPEKYLQAERQRLSGQQALSLDDLQKQQAQAQAQQQSRLAQFGLRGGNSALLSRYSMRDALMARQGLGRQFQEQTGALESKGMELGRETQAKNIGLLGQSVKDINQFELDKWKKQKEVEAAKISAAATKEAANTK